MELVYQGTKYGNTLVYEEGTFPSVPVIRLFSPATKKYYEVASGNVTATPGALTSTSYDFLFTETETAVMLPGAYMLEVYSNDKKDMLQSIEGFIVVPSGKSPDASSGASAS